MIELPPLKQDLERRPVYYYRTKEQSALKLKGYDDKFNLLQKKEGCHHQSNQNDSMQNLMYLAFSIFRTVEESRRGVCGSQEGVRHDLAGNERSRFQVGVRDRKGAFYY